MVLLCHRENPSPTPKGEELRSSNSKQCPHYLQFNVLGYMLKNVDAKGGVAAEGEESSVIIASIIATISIAIVAVRTSSNI